MSEDRRGFLKKLGLGSSFLALPGIASGVASGKEAVLVLPKTDNVAMPSFQIMQKEQESLILSECMEVNRSKEYVYMLCVVSDEPLNPLLKDIPFSNKDGKVCCFPVVSLSLREKSDIENRMEVRAGAVARASKVESGIYYLGTEDSICCISF